MTTSETGSVDYISDWTDIVNATAVTTAGSGQGNITTATTTTIIAAPASGSSRAVRSAMISNRHGSTSNTIQLFKTVGAASYAISKPLVILAGETVRFSDEGFCFVGNACELEVTSATTAEQLKSNATTGVMQIVGPAAGSTRVMTIPDGDFSVARKDAANAFTGDQTFNNRVLIDGATDATTMTDGSLQTDGGLSVVKSAIIGNHVKIVTAGYGIFIKEGSNARMGTATLSSGTATVSTTAVSATSRIFLTIQSLGTVTSPKSVAVTAREAGTSFTITSSDATDTSVVAWMIVDPA